MTSTMTVRLDVTDGQNDGLGSYSMQPDTMNGGVSNT